MKEKKGFIKKAIRLFGKKNEELFWVEFTNSLKHFLETANKQADSRLLYLHPFTYQGRKFFVLGGPDPENLQEIHVILFQIIRLYNTYMMHERSETYPLSEERKIMNELLNFLRKKIPALEDVDSKITLKESKI